MYVKLTPGRKSPGYEGVAQRPVALSEPVSLPVTGMKDDTCQPEPECFVNSGCYCTVIKAGPLGQAAALGWGRGTGRSPSLWAALLGRRSHRSTSLRGDIEAQKLEQLARITWSRIGEEGRQASWSIPL